MLLSILGLLLVPWGKKIGELLGDDALPPSAQNLSVALNETIFESSSEPPSKKMPLYLWAVVVTIFGAIFLDFSADTCQTPARTYMLDLCISGIVK